jgi:hypothetical protein
MSLKFKTISDKFISDIYCVEDVKFDINDFFDFDRSGSIVEKTYSGNYFIFYLNSFLYFHTLHEGIGQYEVLKKIIPDLKISVVAIDRTFDNKKEVMDICLDLIKPYGLQHDDIIFLAEETPIFENIYYYTTRINYLLEQMDVPQGKELHGMYDQYLGGFESLIELYKPYLVKDENSPKKIFITRMEKDDNVRNIHDMFYESDVYDIQKPQALIQEENNWGGTKYIKQLLRERLVPKVNEEKLEQFFISNGYTVIDPEKISFYDQINYYYNATHVASIRGSGLMNTLFCDPGTNIFILDNSKYYEFEYKQICEINSKNVYEIPFDLKLKTIMPEELFNTYNIIGILYTHYKGIV